MAICKFARKGKKSLIVKGTGPFPVEQGSVLLLLTLRLMSLTWPKIPMAAAAPHHSSLHHHQWHWLEESNCGMILLFTQHKKLFCCSAYTLHVFFGQSNCQHCNHKLHVLLNIHTASTCLLSRCCWLLASALIRLFIQWLYISSNVLKGAVAVLWHKHKITTFILISI